MQVRFALAGLVGMVVAGAVTDAHAQSMRRDQNWDRATTITAGAGLALGVLVPRVFYSDPEATVGWKARWHVSALAPTLAAFALGALNDEVLKDEFQGYRPGCNAGNAHFPNCSTYGMVSTHAFYGASALGQGVAVFLIDTLSWSDGRFHGGAFAGEVAVPLALAAITAAGRSAGNYETGTQILAGTGAGLLSGVLLGGMYALMARPECGYTGSLVCW